LAFVGAALGPECNQQLGECEDGRLGS
jgi:hypothetical protein